MADQKSLIESVYRALFRRLPMPAEVTYWQHHFRASGTLDAMRAELVNTHEFQFELRHHLRHAAVSPLDFTILDSLKKNAMLGHPPFAVRYGLLVNRAELDAPLGDATVVLELKNA